MATAGEVRKKERSERKKYRMRLLRAQLQTIISCNQEKLSSKMLRISADHQLSEKDTLMLLYTACGGSSWKENENWGSSKEIGEWFGVVVSPENGCIVELNLRHNMLCGILPPEIFELENLEVLNLSGNKIMESIYGFHKLKNLKELNISKNLLSMTLSRECLEKIITMRNSGQTVDLSQVQCSSKAFCTYPNISS